MKNIEIDEELYQFIASNTQFIGESASSILRRLLAFDARQEEAPKVSNTEEKKVEKPVKQAQPAKGSVFDHINKEELAGQRGAVGRFLLILQALYRVHQQDFEVVCSIRGRDRLYFANNENALAESGSSTKPRQIPESPYWVITNSNTTRKKMMLTEVSLALGYAEHQAEKIRELL
ncbi:replication initiation negative regulator SeqA [Thalassotalea sp. M1531]|uniref:Negative modulator of initiation of replication n=1 Tax=Thalassotalea algicola TaxID=2716224 RepID=A0A7Y0Q7S3_9GAMM|nr:replication initiation negative regulator SeqA [Thalassotalea algicola]NMP32688.1 replication initiation negative regulator SeqA [Thalassotalea algicola]